MWIKTLSLPGMKHSEGRGSPLIMEKRRLILVICLFTVGCFGQIDKETQTIKEDPPGENDLTGSDITSTVKTTSSEQEQNYQPGSIHISPDKGIFFSKRGGEPKEDVVCEADCLPQCTYKWYYASSQKKPGNEWATGNTLFASRKFFYTSHPYYYCEARNNHGFSSSNWIKIDVKDGPENVTITSSQAPIENSPFSLHCSADCLHGCESYRWLKESTQLNKNTAILTIDNLNRADNGKYTCSVEDYFGQSSSAYNLKVQYPPGSVRISPDKDIFLSKRGGTPKEDVVCKADCLPQCTYKWYYASSQRKPGYQWATGNTLFASRKFFYTSHPYYYYCEARNDLGSSSSNWIKIDVKDGPENVTITSSQAPIENSPFSLHCSADCLHGCESYRWLKESTRLNKNTAILTFNNLNRADNGKYTCSVEDYFGQSSSTYNLKVQYPPGSVRISPDKATFFSKRGGTPKEDVVCKADCLPQCTYKWYYASSQRKPGYQWATGNTLFASRKFFYTSHPYFYCAARNDLGSSSSNWIKIDVTDGPENVTITSSQAPIENSPFSLHCSADCLHGCESYLWSDESRRLNKNTAILTIDNLNRVDNGKYTCSVEDYFGQSSSTYNLKVQYPPGSIRISPYKDTFFSKRGGTPKEDVVCEADCLPHCTYKWYYASSKRWSGYEWSTGNTLFASQTFFYTSYPYYYCEARNNHGSSYSNWIKIDVKDGPENVNITSSQAPIENSPFSLHCSADCLHGCESYRWLKESTRLNKNTAILTFDNLNRTDNGKYTCSVEDYFGRSSSTYILNVIYSSSNVTIQYESYNGDLIERQDRIKLICRTNCYPKCSYEFYRNGHILDGEGRHLSKWTLAHRNMSGNYTCSANNSIMNDYHTSTNIVDVRIKYEPKIAITFGGNRRRTTVHAPGTLNLSFSIDSFPSSNVSVFHKTNKLKTIPNVTGQHIYTKPITSCLDEGEYTLEAVNEAGSDSTFVIVNVTCSPMIIRFPNSSVNGFRIGDRVDLTVAYKGNPAAELSWTFHPWNSNASQDVPVHRIQKQSKYKTDIVIKTLNSSDFGTYQLRLKNIHGNISKDFKIQGPPTSPTDLSVECPDVAVVVWKPGFDGGSNQTFIIEYSSNQSSWQTHRPKLAAAFNEDYLKTFVDDISPNTLYFFRIKAHNDFGVALSESNVNCTRQNPVEDTDSLSKQYGFVGVGAGMFLLVIIIGVLVVVLNLKLKRRRQNKDNHLSRKSDNSRERDDVLDIVENILYISADEAKEVPESSGDNVQKVASGNDTYAVVSKGDLPGNNASVYAEVNKTKKKQKPAVPEKSTKVKKRLPPNDNQDGLIYLELDLKDAASSSTGNFVIHGAEDKTEYVDIDFTKRVDPSLIRHMRDERTGDPKENDK